MKQHVCLQQVFGSVHLAFGHVCTQRHPKGNRVLVGIFQLDRKPSERGALTIPAAWSVSCRRRFLVHTPCKAPTGPCRCSRCWRTGSCGTGSPDTPSVPAYWTSSDTKQVWLDGFWVFFSVMVSESASYHPVAERPIPVPDERIGHHERDGVWMRPADGLHCYGYMSQRHLIISHTDLWGIESRTPGKSFKVPVLCCFTGSFSMFVHMITKVSSFLQQKTTASFVVLPLIRK